MKKFARIFPYYARYKHQLILGCLCIPFSSGLDLLIPIIIGKGLDQLKERPVLSVLFTYIAFVIGLAAVKGVFKYFMRLWIIAVSRKVESNLKDDLFKHLSKLSFSYFNKARTGDLLSRATQDVEAVRMFTGPGFMYVSSALLALPIAFCILFWINWKLTLFVAIPLMILAYGVKFLTPRMQEHSQAIQDKIAEISTLAQENFSGVRVVKGFNLEESEIKKFEKQCQIYKFHNLKFASVRGFMDSLIDGSKDIAFVLILAIGGIDLMEKRFSLGDYFVFNSFVLLLFWPLIALGWIVGMYQRAAAAMNRIDVLFKTEPEISDAKALPDIKSIQGSIEIKNLNFSYGEKPALSDINFKIAKGETLGVVGKTGSGKTTLASLIPRLFSPPPGTVFIDGQDVNTIALDVLRPSIGFVPQDNFLFSDTIQENIGFGLKEIQEERIIQAAEKAKIAEEIRGFPKGFQQVIGERGVTLSGGQKQRVSIARALAINPNILIFDDCLSAVDPETERELIENIRSASLGRTTVLIAHRLSVVQNAEQIIVLEDGKIVERGTHAQLIKANGWYAQTWKRQQIEQELEVL